MSRLITSISATCFFSLIFSPIAFSQDGTHMKLHPTPWNIDGQPILGTYIGGADRVEDLRMSHEAGMNVILGDKAELDVSTPEGAYCRDNNLKVIYHVTKHIYHGVKLSAPITADQTDIPLMYAGATPPAMESNIIQLEGETIRYERMTESGLVNCERGFNGTTAAPHRAGMILFWPDLCAEEIRAVKDSPNLFGYYTLDDSPGDGLSALRALYQVVQKEDPGKKHPVCAGYGDAGALTNFDSGVCDLMFIYWYPVSTKTYDRERTTQEVQRMMTTARGRVPGVPFVGIYQAFDGRSAQTGQGVPTPDQLRTQLEDFVRDGASGLVAFISQANSLPGWVNLKDLGDTIRGVHAEIRETGGMTVRPETDAMRAMRIQPVGHWQSPQPFHGVVPAWQVIGPFHDVDKKGLSATFPPDAAIDFAGVYPVKRGTTGWRVCETTCGVLGLTNLYGDHGALHDCVEYAVVDVTSPVAQKVKMLLGTDNDAIITLNGAEIYRYEGPRGLSYDTDSVDVELPAGTSRIVAKIYNRTGMWGIAMRFVDLDGKPLQGLTFSPESE